MLLATRRGWPSGVLLLTVAAGLVMASCSDEDPLGPYDEDAYNWTDRQICALVYGNYVSPPGFYREDYRRGSPYYENTISIRRPICPDDGCWFELSTDDRGLAFAWSESSAVNSAYYRVLASESATEKYFEFRRAWPEHPTDVLLSRVHKSSYLDRSMYDRMHPASILGVYVPRPITAESAQELAEYMWANDLLGSRGTVLASRAADCLDSFCQVILFATLIGGDWGLCDEILLREATVKVHKESGEITCDVRELRSIRGRCYDG
jgi:hypothetical protein